MLTTFYLAKNDHRWATFVPLETITLASAPPEGLATSERAVLRDVKETLSEKVKKNRRETKDHPLLKTIT